MHFYLTTKSSRICADYDPEMGGCVNFAYLWSKRDICGPVSVFVTIFVSAFIQSFLWIVYIKNYRLKDAKVYTTHIAWSVDGHVSGSHDSGDARGRCGES